MHVINYDIHCTCSCCIFIFIALSLSLVFDVFLFLVIMMGNMEENTCKNNCFPNVLQK